LISEREDNRMTRPKVTVLTPTYNRPDTLGDAVESVVNQSFEEWEMLVINDGGVDVAEIVNRFNDPRLVYLDRETNRGKAACLNIGLERANGEYIAYIDDDDMWYPNHLETLSRSLDENPDVGAVYSDLYAVQFKKDEANGKRYPLHKMIQVARDFNRDFMFHYNHTLHVSLMHRKDLAIRAGGYDETVTVLIDWNITRKLCFYTDFKYIQTLTGEYYMTIGKSDRISNMEREDDEKYRHNLRKIKADLPPEPWPKVDSIAVVYPVKEWKESTEAFITRLIDKINYPVRFILVNNEADRTESDCRRSMGKIGRLKNIRIVCPAEPLSELEAYRFGAAQADQDYVYLPTEKADMEMEIRLISAMDYLRRSGCDGAKWDVEQEREGSFDIIMKRDAFLQASDPEKGDMTAMVGVIPNSVPESLICDFFANLANRQHRDGNYEMAFHASEIAGSAKKGGVGDQYLIDIYSKICFDLKKYDEAEDKIRILIERGYGADNWIRLGTILQIKEKYPEAAEAYRKGLEEINLSETDLDSPVFPIFITNDFGAFVALQGIGECMAEMEDLTGAARMFRRAAKLKANSTLPFLGFARIFLKAGDLNNAEAALLSARLRDDTHPEVHRLMGLWYEKNGNLHKAFDCYRKAQKLDAANPKHIEPIYRVGLALGYWDDMKDIFEDFLNLRPVHLPCIGYLTSVYYELGEYGKAEALAQRGLIFDPGDRRLKDLYLKLETIEDLKTADRFG
jgi:glycosyltransferase involved in cell wall biosynthesis